MTRDKYEIKRIYIPRKQKVYPAGDYTVVAPVNSDNTESEWKKAEELSAAGWELVDSVPIIGSEHASSFFEGHHSYLSYPFTFGYVLLFQRKTD